jgi:hypothetical protein
MGCYTCKLHQNQDALFNQQRIEVSGEKRDIDALQRFLESDKNATPYAVESRSGGHANATLSLTAPKTLEGNEPFTMNMIATHMNVIGEELQLLANQQVLPSSTTDFGKRKL